MTRLSQFATPVSQYNTNSESAPMTPQKGVDVRLFERASTRLSAAAAPSVQQLGSRLTRPSSNCSAGPRTAVAQLQQPVHLVDEPGKTSHMQHTHCRCQPRALDPGQARGGLGIPACAYGLQQPVQRCAASLIVAITGLPRSTSPAQSLWWPRGPAATPQSPWWAVPSAPRILLRAASERPNPASVPFIPREMHSYSL